MSTATVHPLDTNEGDNKEDVANQEISNEERLAEKTSAMINLSQSIATGEAVKEQEEETVESCSNCHSTTPRGTSSWCPECGYYPGVAEGGVEDLTEEAEVPVPLILQPWCIALMSIIGLFFVVSVGARYYFVFHDATWRASTAVTLMAIGGTVAAANHLLASLVTLQNDAELGGFDILGKPLRMWRSVIDELPETGPRLVCGASGLTAFLCGAIVIGGIDYNKMFERERKEQPKQQLLKGAVNAITSNKPDVEPGSMEDALNDVADAEPGAAGEEGLEGLEGLADKELAGDESESLPQPGEPVRCVIYGFQKEGKKTFSRILLACEINGEKRHVCSMDSGDFSEKGQKLLLKRMSPWITDSTDVKTRYQGIWVVPKIGLNIEFSGWDPLGEMLDPTVSRTPKAKSPRATESVPPAGSTPSDGS